MMLLSRAKLGTRFELRGQRRGPSARPGFGLLWRQSWLMTRRATTGGASSFPTIRNCTTAIGPDIWCTLHNNSHGRKTVVNSSDDFRVVVYDDQVGTTVGAVKEGGPLPFVLNLEHDPPTADTPFGVGTTPDWLPNPPVVVRFTQLRVRKLTVPPSKMKMPEPE